LSVAGLYLVNVGVNAAHRARSPRFADGSFEFVPIPERTDGRDDARWRRYRDLPTLKVPRPSCWPAAWAHRAVHADPDFALATYGDLGRGGRSAGLLDAGPGDRLLFLARLVDWHPRRGWGAAGFYLVGHIDISEVLRNCRGPEALPERHGQRLANQAHVVRARVVQMWDGFYLFLGAPSSRGYSLPAPLNRVLAARALRRADGGEWRWRAGRSDLWTIGIYTRAARLIARTGRSQRDDARILALKAAVDAASPGEWGVL
jgi:hypothetical protein